METFEKEEISKHLLDANKLVPRYDFLQEFCIINGELKGNKSVSRGDGWLVIPLKKFLPKKKRYHNDFHSYFSIDTFNSLGQKFFKFQGNDGRAERIEMSRKEHQVGDKGVNIVQRLTSLLAKVVHYVHSSLFKPP